MAVAEGYYSPQFLQRVRNVDRLAHDIRLDLVRAALATKDQAEPSSIESAAPVISKKIAESLV